MAASKATIVLTGANGGLGSAIAKQIASTPEFASYHAIYTVRNATTAQVFESFPTHLHEVASLNLADLDNVRQTAEAINIRISAGEIPPIRVLILNAAFEEFDSQTWTEYGLDVSFCVNYLGHWLLTLLLLKSMDKESGRIVLISSQAHDPHDKRNELGNAFKDEKYQTILHNRETFKAIAEGTWSSTQEDPSWCGGFRRYGVSKFLLVMMIHELQRRMDQDPSLKNICILGVDPGTMPTTIVRRAPWIIRVFAFQVYFPLLAWLFPNGEVRSTQKSATHVLRAAFNSDETLGEFPKAKYFHGLIPLETNVETRDAQKSDWVWKETVQYAKLKEDETVLANIH